MLKTRKKSLPRAKITNGNAVKPGLFNKADTKISTKKKELDPILAGPFNPDFPHLTPMDPFEFIPFLRAIEVDKAKRKDVENHGYDVEGFYMSKEARTAYFNGVLGMPVCNMGYPLIEKSKEIVQEK